MTTSFVDRLNQSLNTINPKLASVYNTLRLCSMLPSGTKIPVVISAHDFQKKAGIYRKMVTRSFNALHAIGLIEFVKAGGRGKHRIHVHEPDENDAVEIGQAVANTCAAQMQCYLLDGLSGGPDSEAAQLIKDVFLGFQRDTVQKICPGWSHRQLAIPETVVGHVVGQLVGQFAPTTGVVGQFAPTNLPRCSSLSSSMRGASGAEDVVGRSGSLPDAPVGFDGTPGAGGDHVDPIERPTLTEAQKKAMRVGSAAKYKADHNPPEKPRTQGGKARTSATLKRGDIYDFNLYEPILKQLFGEDCLTTSSEGFLQANPDFLTAGKVVDFFHDGAGGGGWFWRAGPGDPVRFLTCYRAYLTLVGNKGGGEAPSMLRKLASRARIQAAKRIDSRDMPTVMAGFLFRYILSMSEEKPYLAPPFSKWDQLWTPENAFSMKIHYEQAATAGLVPTSPLDFLQKIDAYWGAEGGLLRLTKSQAQELLNKKLTMNEKVAKALGLST